MGTRGAVQELVLELTGWCPQRCLHCSSASGPENNSFLSPATVIRLIDEAVDLGASKISFGGGEPTSTPLLMASLNQAVDHGLQAEVFTCGVAGPPGQPSPLPVSMVERFAALKGLKLIFSFHSYRRETHDFIAQNPGSHSAALSSLKACLASGIDCEINFVPLRTNFEHLPKLVELSKSLGIARVSILRFVPQGRGLEHRDALELFVDEEQSLIQTITRLRSEGKVELRTGSPFNGLVPGNRVPCRAGRTKLVVQPDGNVLPCEVFKDCSRRQWGMAANMHLAEMLSSPSVGSLAQLLKGRGALCPVHCGLRRERVDIKEGSIESFSA